MDFTKFPLMVSDLTSLIQLNNSIAIETAILHRMREYEKYEISVVIELCLKGISQTKALSLWSHFLFDMNSHGNNFVREGYV